MKVYFSIRWPAWIGRRNAILISTAAKIEESSNLCTQTPNIPIRVVNWFFCSIVVMKQKPASKYALGGVFLWVSRPNLSSQMNVLEQCREFSLWGILAHCQQVTKLQLASTGMGHAGAASDTLQTKTSRNISPHLLSPVKDTGPAQPAGASKKTTALISMGQ